MPLYVSGTRPLALPRYGGDGSGDPVPWWKTPYGRWRLSVEVEAMRRFRGFVLSRTVEGLSWRGYLRTSLDPKRRYIVRVTYPQGFPDESPVVTIEKPGLPSGTPHLLDGNRPCLYQPSQGSRHGYDPARTTAGTLVAWTALWIHAFETWGATDVWPGRGA